MSTTTQFIVLGCVGGLLPDVLRVIKNKYENNLPDYFKHANFWLGVVLLVVLGGLAAWLLEANSVKDAVAYGFAAPELISRLVSKTTEKPEDRGGNFDLRKWWAS